VGRPVLQSSKSLPRLSESVLTMIRVRCNSSNASCVGRSGSSVFQVFVALLEASARSSLPYNSSRASWDGLLADSSCALSRKDYPDSIHHVVYRTMCLDEAVLLVGVPTGCLDQLEKGS
jgi:hypothetical protein